MLSFLCRLSLFLKHTISSFFMTTTISIVNTKSVYVFKKSFRRISLISFTGKVLQYFLIGISKKNRNNTQQCALENTIIVYFDLSVKYYFSVGYI